MFKMYVFPEVATVLQLVKFVARDWNEQRQKQSLIVK